MTLLATLPWRTAIACRWGARILGSLTALFFVLLFVGEGIPAPWTWTVRETFIFTGFGFMIAGLIVAWFWEGLGGMLAVTGFSVHVAVARDSALSLLTIVLAVGVLHVLCWLRVRSGTGINRDQPNAG